MKPRLDIVRWLALALMAVAAWFNYRAMISYTMVMFASPLEDMTYGWAVPFVSLYVLWTQRKALRAQAGSPSLRGCVWVFGILVLAWLGGRGAQSRLEQLSLIGLVWAVPFAFWGRGVEQLMRFPAAYLMFTIPVSSFIDFFTIHLRILSSSLATVFLNGVGVGVERSGTALFSRVPGAEFNVDVANPCSGIQSLFAMMALVAAYSFFTQKTVAKRCMLFVCSLPIAILGNTVRIIFICLLATWFGQEIATGDFHVYYGYVTFLVGVLLMVQTGDLIQKYGDAVERRLPTLRAFPKWRKEPESRQADESTWRAVSLVCCVCALTVMVFAGNLSMPAPVYDSSSFVASSLPETIGDFVGEVPWFCNNPQCLKVAHEQELVKAGMKGADGFTCPLCGGIMHRVSLGEETALPADTVIIKRNYRSSDGVVYAVSLVIGGRSRGSIHRPELCLPAQGYVMVGAERMPLRLTDGSPLMVRKITAKGAGGATISLVYWFLSRESTCCSHTERILLDVWDRSIHNRINRWVMVAVNVSSPLDSPESVARFETFIAGLNAKVIKHGRIYDE